MQRFIEEIDYIDVLSDAGLVKYDALDVIEYVSEAAREDKQSPAQGWDHDGGDSGMEGGGGSSQEEEGGPRRPRRGSKQTSTTTVAARPQTPSDNGKVARFRAVPVEDAKEKLNEILTAQRFIWFYNNQAVEDGFQRYILRNHLAYLVLYWIAGGWLNIGWIAGGTFTAGPLLTMYTIFSLLSCPIVALFLARTPLQLKSPKHRANLHEVHCVILRFFGVLNQALLVASLLDGWCTARTIGGTYVSQHHNCMYDSVFYIAYLQSSNAMIITRLTNRYASLILVLLVAVIGAWSTQGPEIPARYYGSLTMVLLVCAAVFAMQDFVRERVVRRTYQTKLRLALQKVEVAAAVQRANGVMHYLLPESVLSAIVAGESVFHTENATVIQADVCNFTLWCSTRKSYQVVEMLSVVMGTFDELALQYEVTRIQLLGDGYIAVCGLPECLTDHAVKGVLFAIGLQEALTRSTASHPSWGPMEVRAGVHSGRVSAGVLSRQRWSYDLFGDVPSIACALEGQAAKGGVLVSEATMSLLPADMQAGIHAAPGPKILRHGVHLRAFAIFVRNVDLVVNDLISVSSRGSSQQALGRGQSARALLTGLDPMPLAGAEELHDDEDELEVLSPVLPVVDRKSGLDAPVAEIVSDPTPIVYEQFTKFWSLGLLCISLALFVSWGVETNATLGTGSTSLLVYIILNGINVCCFPLPRAQRYITPVLGVLGVGVVETLVSNETRMTATILSFTLACLPYLYFDPHWLAYVGIIGSSALALLLRVATRSLQIPTHPIGYVVSAILFSFLRSMHYNEMQRLSTATAQRNEELVAKENEKSILEQVLKLKMPAHIVDHLFAATVGGGTGSLNSSYHMKSCHVAFCRFQLAEGDHTVGAAPPLSSLQLLTTLMDETLPSSGTGKFNCIEKIKTIGDTVMIGGALAPDLAAEVTDEEVLSELLTFFLDLAKAMAASEELQGARWIIGVDCGEVTTATVGHVNLEYDVFGSTVNTAARVMATLDTGSSKVTIESEDDDINSPKRKDAKTGWFSAPNTCTLVRCSEHVMPGLMRLQKAIRTGQHARMSAKAIEELPRFEAVGEMTFQAKGLGLLSGYYLVPAESCKD